MKFTRTKPKVVKYRDLLGVLTRVSDDQLVTLPRQIKSGFVSPFNDMRIYFDGNIMVRQKVVDRLLKAQQKLVAFDSNFCLFVVYGYRTLEIQTAYFLKELAQCQAYYDNPVDLYEAIHKKIAVPSVAGHPTGGAVDVTLWDKSNNRRIDCGSILYDFNSPAIEVFSTKLTKSDRTNRFLLRKVMLEAGFAPFDGEWWHFSYGDCEWAYYYNQPFAIYDQVPLGKINKIAYNKYNV